MFELVLPEADVGSWDLTVDVLVVGLGCAGAAAGIEAARCGAATLVLERASGGGGTTAMSGAVIYMGGGTPIQKACGFDDSPEEMYKYLCAACGVAPDQTKIRMFCEESVSTFDWLVSLGIPFKPSFWTQYSEPTTDDGLYFSGQEHAHPFNTIAKPAPRGHALQAAGSVGQGRILMDKLELALRQAGAVVAEDSRCAALVRSQDGRICGAAVKNAGVRRHIRARRGVVLATGGFIQNREMVARYAPQLINLEPLGGEYDDGSGIQLAQAAGGDVINMAAAAFPCPVLRPAQLMRGILLNEHGQRFINEDVNHKRIGEYSVLRQNGKMYLFVDNAIFTRPIFPNIKLIACGDTVAEVEAEMKLPPPVLQETVAFFNHYAAQGLDPLFGKLPQHLAPLISPPFGVFDCSAGSGAPYSAFTLGGLRTTPSGEVLATTGDVISRLYAAGRTTSGISAQSCGGSGLQIAEGIFFGRLAGRGAARAC